MAGRDRLPNLVIVILRTDSITQLPSYTIAQSSPRLRVSVFNFFLRDSAPPRLIVLLPIQSQFLRNSLHSFNAKRDVLFQVYAKFGGAFGDVVAADAAGEGFVFHFFAHGFGLYFGQG